MQKKYTITAALPYANGALHLGHLAGVYVPADIYARFLRLLGRDVVFVCGSDEHGAAITIKAKKEGSTPREIIDKYHALNKETFGKLGISFDVYHRTSEPLHHETAQGFFTRLLEKGNEFEVQSSEQYYDEQFHQFLADRYIVGTCPKCGHHEAYGDQCEKCGSDLSPTDLINPRSTLSGKAPVKRTTQHWFFKLDKHADWLRHWLETGKVDGLQLHDTEAWKKHVIGQCLSWLDGGLHPRAITRDLDWGIPVPLDDAKGKVLYVWFDAPIGYISATRQWALDNGKNWEDYWKSDSAELVHFIGKDNIVFHCIVFPAMLHAHGDYVLPKNVPANQFLNLEGRKFSKSKGWVIEQHQYLEEFKDFPNREDALRYALLRTMPENQDGDFKWDEFVNLYDSELADTVGNFFNRVMTFTHKYFGGKVPQWDKTLAIKGLSEGEQLTSDAFLKNNIVPQLHLLLKQITAYEFRNAAQTALDIARWGNTLFQNNEPWKRAAEDPNAPEVAAGVALGAQIAAVLSLVMYPFVPFAGKEMRRLLGLPDVQNGDLQAAIHQLEQGNWLLAVGAAIEPSGILFTKIKDRKDRRFAELIELKKRQLDELRKRLEAEEKAAESQKAEALKAEISIEDFQKIDLRVATILNAQRVPKADKLLQLTLDLGFEQRTVLSGIAEFYQPEDIIGQQVVVVANLAPRVMRGIESKGMILMATDNEGKLIFVDPKGKGANGAQVK